MSDEARRTRGNSRPGPMPGLPKLGPNLAQRGGLLRNVACCTHWTAHQVKLLGFVFWILNVCICHCRTLIVVLHLGLDLRPGAGDSSSTDAHNKPPAFKCTPPSLLAGLSLEKSTHATSLRSLKANTPRRSRRHRLANAIAWMQIDHQTSRSLT